MDENKTKEISRLVSDFNSGFPFAGEGDNKMKASTMQYANAETRACFDWLMEYCRSETMEIIKNNSKFLDNAARGIKKLILEDKPFNGGIYGILLDAALKNIDFHEIVGHLVGSPEIPTL